MLYFPAHTLAAIENDRLRTAERYRLLAKVRREQAAPGNRRRRPRWQVFRVSSMTGSAS
jgi:hypothetical protein